MTASAGLVAGRTRGAVAQRRATAIAIPRGAACRLRGALDGARAPASPRREGADIIDINMGCPSQQVTKGAAGSALMRDLDHALTLIEATVARGARAGHAEDAARLG